MSISILSGQQPPAGLLLKVSLMLISDKDNYNGFKHVEIMTAMFFSLPVMAAMDLRLSLEAGPISTL